MSPPTSIAEILAAVAIKLKSLRAGHTEHVICPKCEGGRSRETCLSVTIDNDAGGATWVCHRGTCGWRDGARVRDTSPPVRLARGYQVPAPATDAQKANRPDWLYDFFSQRNIGARTVHELGIYATTRRFPDPVGESPAIVFPYLFRGEVVNRKYRPHPAKNPMLQERDALPTLFNVDRLGDDPEAIVWVEGEMDVAAMFECGIKNAVSLKDGAPASLKAEIDPDAKRFAALKTHATLLGKVKRIILAGDMDAPGLTLREELARRLGRHRCLTVTWPAGYKDAGDVLRKLGPDAVVQAVQEATPYPIEGLQRIEAGTLLALRRLSPPGTMTTGAMATDAILKLPTEGRLIVLTGFPGHGKTNWTRFVMVHTAGNHARRWAVFSPEMQPWEQFAAECAEVWSGKPFWPVHGVPSMSEGEICDAETWLGERITMLVCDAEEEAPTVDWILDHARAAVLRDGCTDLLIDPWNEIDHTRPGGTSETEYIGRCLQRLKAFGLRHGCNIWLIAHPAKPAPLKPGDTRGAPGPYDINGSAHWFNRADLGITVHSPASGSAEVHVWKSRFRRWAGRGTFAGLDFNSLVGTYSTPLSEMVRDQRAPTPHPSDR
jgi:twinkle protein